MRLVQSQVIYVAELNPGEFVAQSVRETPHSNPARTTTSAEGHGRLSVVQYSALGHASEYH